jgi:hypothetical protein
VDAKAIDARKPLDGLVLEGSSGTCQKGITIANVRNARLRGIQVTGFSGPLLSTVNVSGKGIENASKAAAPVEPALIAASAVPYQLR